LSESDTVNYYAFFDKPVPENIGANRRGVLNAQQRSAIEQTAAYHKMRVSLIVVLTIFVALFIFLLLWKAENEDGIVRFSNLVVSVGAVTILLGSLAMVFTGDLFLLFARDDYEGGKVESVIGKVVWNGSRYQVHSDSRQLRSLRAGVILPPPGDYRFYYLPSTGLVVMAEEMGELTETKSASRLLEALATSNYFSPEDLDINRSGRLSENQQNRLMRIAALYGLILLSSAGLCGISIFQLLRGNSSILFILLILIGLFLILRFGWSITRIISDMWRGEVNSLEGSAVRQAYRSRYRRYYHYVIGSHKFHVFEAAYNALVEGQRYRIFYVPRSKRLVSIKPI
jgi:hypothetical protein